MKSINSYEKWKRLLAEQPTSGESIKKFCDRNNVPASQFFYWRKRLATKNPTFTTVAVKSLETKSGEIKLTLPNSLSLEFPASISMSQLAEFCQAINNK